MSRYVLFQANAYYDYYEFIEYSFTEIDAASFEEASTKARAILADAEMCDRESESGGLHGAQLFEIAAQLDLGEEVRRAEKEKDRIEAERKAAEEAEVLAFRERAQLAALKAKYEGTQQ